MAEHEENEEYVKLTLLGSSGVGKTCIIRRYTEGDFDDNNIATSGASYSQKHLEIDGKKITIDLWDTAGQEKYRSLGRHFYKDSYIVCLVYDITVENSFIELKEKWYPDLKQYGEKYNVVAVVGNKSDCYEQEEVKEEDAREFATSIQAIFKLTSAKTGDNIEDLFDTLIRSYLGPDFAKKLDEIKEERGETTKVTRTNKEEKKVKKGGFC